MTTPLWQPGHLYLPGDLVQPIQSAAPVSTALTNPGFESGVITGWTVTTSGAGTSSVASDKKYAGTYAGRWQGVGGGASADWVNATEVPVKPGQSVSASMYLSMDDTGSSANQARSRLYWYNAAHTLLSHTDGLLIHGNTSAWYASPVTGVAPATAAYCRMGAWTTANASGGVRVDSASWSIVAAAAPAGLIYKAVQTGPGTSASGEPIWPSTLAATVVDGTVTWEAVQASRVVWEASPICLSGATEPDWPTDVGGFVTDGTISWECISRRVEDDKCPNSKEVVILAGKVFAGDGDIVRFCATANPLDWSSADDAGYLPTGLQQANANDMAVLNQYRSNLVAFNASSFQNWQADPDPAAMALLDQMEGIGSSWQHAAQPVANDLFYLSQLGVRSVGIAAGADNLSAGDIGMPIDVLVKAAMANAATYDLEPIATYYPSAGQYWLAFPEVTRIACSVPAVYDGGQAIPSVALVDMGSTAGSVLFRLASGAIPAKAEVYIAGVLVLDTGWWGDASYQAALDTACTHLGLTTGTIQPIPTPGVNATVQWASGEAAGFLIDKDTADAQATVKIYAPLDGTAWKFQLGCPSEAELAGPTIMGDAPGSTVGSPYSFTYTATGGTPPYHFDVVAGSLPDGLALDPDTSEISGASTTVEAPTFTVRVMDANGLIDTVNDQIAISAGTLRWGLLTTDQGSGLRPGRGTEIWLSDDALSWPDLYARTASYTPDIIGTEYADGVSYLGKSGITGISTIAAQPPTGGNITATNRETNNAGQRVRAVGGLLFKTHSANAEHAYAISQDLGASWTEYDLGVNMAGICRLNSGRWIALFELNATQYAAYSDQSVPTTWTAASVSISGTLCHDIACDGTTALFVGADQKVYTTTNGATYSTATVFPVSVGVPYDFILRAGATPGLFVAGKDNATSIYRTTNSGASWATVSMGDAEASRGCVQLMYAAGRWVATFSSGAGSPGPVYVSTNDAASFTASTLPYANYCSAVVVPLLDTTP